MSRGYPNWRVETERCRVVGVMEHKLGGGSNKRTMTGDVRRTSISEDRRRGAGEAALRTSRPTASRWAMDPPSIGCRLTRLPSDNQRYLVLQGARG